MVTVRASAVSPQTAVVNMGVLPDLRVPSVHGSIMSSPQNSNSSLWPSISIPSIPIWLKFAQQPTSLRVSSACRQVVEQVVLSGRQAFVALAPDSCTMENRYPQVCPSPFSLQM